MLRRRKLLLLENQSIFMVKYGCNRVIFIAIPSNSNNVVLVKSSTIAVTLYNGLLCCCNNHVYCHVMKHCDQ
jgi:hypothetical protein